MEVIYSAQRSGFEPGKIYRNPRYFEAADPKVSKVIVCGDWPDVVAAYKELGTSVEIWPGPLKAGTVPPIPEGLKMQASAPQAQQNQVQNPTPAGADEDPASSATQDPPKIQTPEEIAAADKSEARAAYIAAIGKPPGPKWDAAKIREEMAKRLAEAKKNEGGE